MKSILVTAGLAVILGACSSPDKKTDAAEAGNPLLSEFTTPFGVPPFDKITLADYKPAFIRGMHEQMQEIDAIVNQRSVPDFENTIVALDQSGALLRQIGRASCRERV